MKKKLLTLVLLLSLCLAAFFTGCKADDVDKIKFTTSPATTFEQTVGAEAQEFSFGLEVTVDGKESTFDVKYLDGKAYVNEIVNSAITVTNFDLTTLGEKTAVVKYKTGDTELSLSFAYTVVASTKEFAGGTGTEKDPYKVASTTHFQNMLNKVNNFAYYVLINDIDFADYVIKTPTYYDEINSSKVFTGVVDGNGYILKNVKNAQFDKLANKYMTIFGVVGNFTLKDITVNFAVDADCVSPVSAIAINGIEDSKLNFENVDVTGFTDGKAIGNSGFAPYVTFIGRRIEAEPQVVNFKDCVSSINMYNTNGRNAVAGFAAVNNSSTKTEVKFDGCQFNGYIEGASKALGAFCVNNGSGDFTKATIANCSVAGTFVDDGSYDVTPVGVHAGNTATANTALTISADKITTVEKFEVTYDNGWKLTKIDGVASYAVVVVGSMYYVADGTSSGACTYQHNITVDENGAFDIYQVKYNAGNFVAPETDELGLSALVKLEDGVLNYYGKGNCVDIDFTKATIKVLGYDADGKLVAYGDYTTKVDLDAVK